MFENFDQFALIDVRSEGEFAQANLPGFINLPILNDQERHQVGLTYKQKGQTQAIELGHHLVEPHREARVAKWIQAIEQSPQKKGYVMCWRGGLRSKIATEWIKVAWQARAASAAKSVSECDLEVHRIEGGYKKLRSQIIEAYMNPPSLLVLSGVTGSGKTKLLHQVSSDSVPVLDLETMAAHRGSSFGRQLGKKQPTQATFENAVGFELISHCCRSVRNYEKRLVVEDESSSIGYVWLPPTVKQKMRASPVVVLEASLEERVQNVYEDYIVEPLQTGFSEAEVYNSLKEALCRIEKKLGGLKTRELSQELKRAFEGGLEPSVHQGWISTLLEEYYDPLYRYAFERQNREIKFKGGFQECLKAIPEFV